MVSERLNQKNRWNVTTHSGDGWQHICEQFVKRISPAHRTAVRRILHDRPCANGSGLRSWIEAVAFRCSPLPARIPTPLVRTYLIDPEAAPLHECEQCGVAIPVRPNRSADPEDEPELVYFNQCPVCHSRTGPFLYRGSRST